MNRAVTVFVAGTAIFASAVAASAQSLKGSPQTMRKQHGIAVQNDYSFLKTSDQVKRFVNAGLLERLPGNADYGLAAVSYPYARPALKLFVERLAGQYRAACGQKLIVTSLTRPVQKQPRNASDLSVHPAGMAVDLRVSSRRACRQWLEETLLSLEQQGVLDATRERYPPHYHVALFTESYTRYVSRITGGRGTAALASAVQDAVGRSSAGSTTAAATPAPSSTQAVSAEVVAADIPAVDAEPSEYRIRPGDSLWSIARRHGIRVDDIKQLNGLNSSAIRAGDVIRLPTVAASDPDS